jgi:GNAT superfamily N-acetyltransferase
MVDAMKNFDIRLFKADEIGPGLKLALDTFMEFEAPVYSDEGVEMFRNFLYSGELNKMYISGDFLMWGCYADNILAGIMAVKNTSHISLAFTRKDFHRQGIGRMLFESVKEHITNNSDANKITVNSSPYGIPFYHALGFKDTNMEQIENGIRFTPMKFIIQRGVNKCLIIQEQKE